jgi:hypothetical protein
MAGDWIAIRCDLANEPEVISIAEATGLDEYGVVGRLHRLWSWANRHTTDGNAISVTYAWVDRYLQRDGFSMAMESVGWLSHDGAVLLFPKFDRFNSQGAKQRLLTAKRVASHKRTTNAEGNGATVTKALPKEQNRTEQSKGASPLKPPARFVPPTLDEVIAYCKERGNAVPPEAFHAHYTTNGWVQGRGKPVKDWKACIVTWEQNRGGGSRGSPDAGSTPRTRSGYEILPME